MPKIRVLVVDDSVVIRRLISEMISEDPLLEVAGIAPNGRIALQRIPQVNPDVITLDIEMPEMDGLQTLQALRKDYPKLPVIMFSTLTQRGAVATLDALAAGATDYVTKPANVGSMAEGLRKLAEELIPKIKAHGPRPLRAPPQILAAPPRTTLGTSAPHGRKVEVLCVGTSTGGPNALVDLFSGFPADFRLPVLIVQHMPPVFTKMLAERLSSLQRLHFHEGEEGMKVEPGHGYIAPGGRHMEVYRCGGRALLRLHDGPPENSCRPAVDVLFRSAVTAYGANVLGVILTGMGADGLLGCRSIREHHGQVIAQDEASSVVWGMPGHVAQAGLADRVLPLNQIASEILRKIAVGQSSILQPA